MKLFGGKKGVRVARRHLADSIRNLALYGGAAAIFMGFSSTGTVVSAILTWAFAQAIAFVITSHSEEEDDSG